MTTCVVVDDGLSRKGQQRPRGAAVDDDGGLSTKPCEYHLTCKGEDFDQAGRHPNRPTLSNSGPKERIADMKHHLLTSVAVVAALAFSAPVWAQQVNPSGGNSMGSPGPNPGGPGLTPYSSGPRTTAAPPPSAPPPAMAPSAMPPSSYDNTSATPPSHRHARHYHAKGHYDHATAGTYHRGKGYRVNGSTANQLNQEELARLQAGNYSNPSAPSYPGGSAPPPYHPPMGTTGGGAPYRP
jgi:hypothetical protein